MRFPDWLPVFGDRSFRGDCPTEALEQITFFAELERRAPDLAAVALHPRNEGKRNHMQTARQKAEGLNVGAADILIPARRCFVCELKRRDHTKSQWQPGQLDYLEAADAMGAWVCVALGWEGAWNAVLEWERLGLRR